MDKKYRRPACHCALAGSHTHTPVCVCVRTCAIMWTRKPVYAVAPTLPMSPRPDLLFIRVVLPQVRVPASLAFLSLKIPAHYFALPWIRVQDHVGALVNPSNYQKPTQRLLNCMFFRKLCSNYACVKETKGKKNTPTRLIRLFSS